MISGGGLLVGAIAGVLTAQVIGRIDNYLIETTLTTLLAYGSYLIAEYVFGVSGVLAVVAAGHEYQRHYARAIALRAAVSRLKQLDQDGLLSDYTWRKIKPQLDRKTAVLAEGMHAILEAEPGLHQQEITGAWREALRAQCCTLNALFRDNILPEDTYSELASEVDFHLSDPAKSWENDIEQDQSGKKENGTPD